MTNATALRLAPSEALTTFASSPPALRTAHLDPLHVGDIEGAFGSIAVNGPVCRKGWRGRLTTLLAILGPGLIVMVGDNDAGAFGGHIARDLIVPGLPHDGKLSEVMLLIIAIVGTTVAPWQLFFQQSYVIDKRIRPRFMNYEKADLWLGIALVIVGGVAMMAFAAAAFGGTHEAGQFADARAVAVGLAHHSGRIAGILFAVALIDASIIGASAVSLATAYAIGDTFKLNHSLHRKPGQAIGFYLVYAGLIALAATLVLIPGTPLGLLTNAVKALAGVLLPSATVFLLLCNDKAVLGPWCNGRWLNLFTGAVVAVLVMLSIVLTASVLYPEISGRTILMIFGGGTALGLIGWLVSTFLGKKRSEPIDRSGRADWRMPPIDELPAPHLSGMEKVWIGVLRGYLVVAAGLVLVRIVDLALNHLAVGG